MLGLHDVCTWCRFAVCMCGGFGGVVLHCDGANTQAAPMMHVIQWWCFAFAQLCSEPLVESWQTKKTQCQNNTTVFLLKQESQIIQAGSIRCTGWCNTQHNTALQCTSTMNYNT